ncbi:MAG: fibronectin type III domain-containing protein, partial [Chloroflexi bacterium]|nr:fibronectin type III domain-containing protein [Chloroflexota bacterium]
FGLSCLLLALLTSLANAAPSTATVDGSITLDKAWYTNTGPGAVVTITVTDADFNVATTHKDTNVNIAPDAKLAAGSSFLYLTISKPVIEKPVALKPGTNTPKADLDVAIVDATLGIVQIFAGADMPTGTLVDLSYKSSAKDGVVVTLTSTQDGVGFTETAVETDFNTGVFKATIVLGTSSSTATSPKRLWALDQASITASFKDVAASGALVTRTVTASVDTRGPVFSGFTPADKYSSQDRRPVFGASATDQGGAGMSVSNVTIFMDTNSTCELSTVTDPTDAKYGKVLLKGTTTIVADPSATCFASVGEQVSATVTGNNSDSTITFTKQPAADLAALNTELDVLWLVQAFDVAGNKGTSDCDTSKDGAQPCRLKVDTKIPLMTGAETGKFWNTSVSPAAESSNRTTSLAVRFNEAIDPASVQPTDFLVGGVSPTDAVVYTDNPATVYLTMGTAMATDARPKVEFNTVASGAAVADLASNLANASNNLAIDKAADKIAPKVAVTLDKTVTKDKVVITVVASEPIAGVPEVKVYRLTTDTPAPLTANPTGINTWQSTFNVSGTDGKKAVAVKVTDVNNNPSSAPKTDPADPAAITFTQDTVAPTVWAVTAGGLDISAASKDVPSTNLYVTVSFSETVTITTATFGVKGGTQKDVKAEGQLRPDGKLWSYFASGLTVDTYYTINISSTDVAGNNQAAVVTKQFQVVASPPSAPSNVRASITWDAPASDGGSPVLYYTVTSNPGGISVFTDAATLAATVKGLTGGVSYTFTVAATNAAGEGPASEPSNAVTAFLPPSVNAGPDQTVNEGMMLSLGALFTDTDAGETHAATISWGDGASSVGVVSESPQAVSGFHVYPDNGVFTVTVKVVDSGGLSGTDSFIATVKNVAPAVNAGPDAAINEGSTFTSSGSFADPGADTWTATVSYGDGSGVQALPLAGKTFALSHQYNDNGVYLVGVTVTDDDGGSGSDTAQVTVKNVAPAVNAGPDAAINEGSTFTSSGSFADPGADTWTATVSYGDGSGVQALPLAGKTFNLSHQYKDSGTFAVTVTVTDDDGGVGSATAIVTVKNVAPAVNAGPDASINEGGTFNSGGSFTDPGADTWSATVSYGDGSGIQALPLAGKTFALSHLYKDNGAFRVTVTVKDDDGGVGADIALVTVKNLPPTVDAGPDLNGVEGSPVSLGGATFKDPGALDTHTAAVSWGDGVTTPGAVNDAAHTIIASHVYADNGVYTVTVTVTDDDGASAADSLVVKIANAAPVVSAATDATIFANVSFTKFLATISDPGARDTHKATVDWGDGSVTVGEVRSGVVYGSHRYTKAGLYTVTITVQDDDGGVGKDTLRLRVEDPRRAPRR